MHLCAEIFLLTQKLRSFVIKKHVDRDFEPTARNFTCR